LGDKFGGEYAAWLFTHLFREGQKDTGDGRSNSIEPNNRILTKNPLFDEAGKKNDLSLAAIEQHIIDTHAGKQLS
jgi:hypothetical protein